jgi:hypothetical protein
LQAFYALSADRTGYLGYPLAGRFTFPDSAALARALPTTPRGLYRRLGIGKTRNQLLPSPCPEGRALTETILTPGGVAFKGQNVHSAARSTHSR